MLADLSLLLVTCAATLKLNAQAGPPFQTDDPTPVDLGHYEAYVFGTVDGTPADTISPGFKFNWGAIPNIQLHVILPLGAAIPSNKPVYSPGGIGPSAFGVQDLELGVKYGFIKQTKHRPQIGSFTMFRDSDRKLFQGARGRQGLVQNSQSGLRRSLDLGV